MGRRAQQPGLPFQSEVESLAAMNPLQQQVVELFDRFQEFNWGYQDKVEGPIAQGKAKDWRAQVRIDQLFLRQKFLQQIADNPRHRPHPKPEIGDILGERAIQNRLKWFMQIMEAKLAQMEGNDRLKKRRYPTVNEWKDSPWHVMHAFQDILCDPTDKIIFTEKELNEKDENDNPIGLQKAMQAIIINPEKITDTLLENLGLEEFSCRPTPEKPRTSKTERLQRYTQAIPEIRRILMDLEFIRRPNERDNPIGQLKYFRMMRIGEGQDFAQPNPNAGMILGTQINNGKRILFQTDIHGADRRLIHIDHTYLDEQEKLHTIEEAINSVDRNSEAWIGPSNEAKRDELHTALLSIIQSLEHVQDYHKKRLRRNLKSYLNLMGQSNPGAAQWDLDRAHVNLGKRLTKMDSTSGHLKMDERRVQRLVLDQEQPYSRFLSTIESIQGQFQTTADLKPEIMRPQLYELRKNIQTNMTFEPYLSVGEKCCEAIEQTLRDLATCDMESAAESFLRVYSITKLERAYYKITKANRDLALAGEENANPEAVLSRVTTIYNELRGHAIAPSEDHDSLRETYIEFYEMFREIRFTLGDLLNIEQPDIEAYRPQTGPAQQNLGQTMPPSQPSKTPWKKRLTAILDEQTTRIKGFLRKALDRARHAIRGIQPAAQPDLPIKSYTPEESYEALVNARRIMSDFPFIELIKGLETPN
jgi:hypothetical protein